MHKSWATVVLLVAIAASACGNKSASTVATKPTGTAASSGNAGSAVAVAAPMAPAFDNRTARDGSLVAVDGRPVQLASVWRKKPTVLVFYRGFF